MLNQSKIELINESQEIIKTKDIPLKDFVNKYLTSLKPFSFETDYTITFNENPISKLTINNKISDLTDSYKSEAEPTIIVTAASTMSTKHFGYLLYNSQDDEQLKKSASQLENSRKEFIEKALDMTKLEEKLHQMVIPLYANSEDKENYYIFIRDTMLKRFSIYDEMFTQETSETNTNLSKIKTSESIYMYTKIVEWACHDVLDKIYKYGILFTNSHEKLRQLSDILRKIYFKVVEIINTDMIAELKKSKQWSKNTANYQNFFNKIYDELCQYRTIRMLDGKPSNVKFLKVDKPKVLNYSESTYFEIKALLKEFPNFETFKNAIKYSSEEDLKKEIFCLALERDIKIYDYYGVKMEDLVHGALLYENF